MATHFDKFSLHVEAMRESLEAAKLLVNYNKEQNSHSWDRAQGCLGYPSAILLFSFINAYGNLFYSETIHGIKINTDKKTFAILNSDYFSNQNISSAAIEDLYESFRSKLTHNLALPKNYVMKQQSPTSRWFELSENNKGESIISTIYLVDLLELCDFAFNKIKDEHKKQFESSKKTNDIKYKDLKSNPTIMTVNSSGVTHC
jgi:hypothetical protein